MKRLILISALLLLASNGWSKELVVTGMVCKWTDICAYYKDDKERKCSARNKRTIANFVSQQSDIWLLVSINEVSNTGTVYEFNKDKLEWQRDLEPTVTQENIIWQAYDLGIDKNDLNSLRPQIKYFQPGNYYTSNITPPINSSRTLYRENLYITAKLCGGGFMSYGHCRHKLFPTAKCELKTIEEVDALAEPFIKKHEEQLKKRKF